MSHSPSFSLEELLEHRTFLRRLARRLVDDESLAEDVEQRAWIAAWKSGEGRRGALRPWLAGVTRNIARRLLRDRQRRLRWEESAARTEAQPSAASVVERLELERLLAEEVLALPEPERALIGLHFYEGLSLRESARRLGLAYATAHALLDRGLSRLKRRLPEQLADRSASRLALLFLAFPKTGAAETASAKASLGGGLLMSTKTVGVVVAAAVIVILTAGLGGGLGWLSPEPESSDETPVASLPGTESGSPVEGTRERDSVSQDLAGPSSEREPDREPNREPAARPSLEELFALLRESAAAERQDACDRIVRQIVTRGRSAVPLSIAFFAEESLTPYCALILRETAALADAMLLREQYLGREIPRAMTPLVETLCALDPSGFDEHVSELFRWVPDERGPWRVLRAAHDAECSLTGSALARLFVQSYLSASLETLYYLLMLMNDPDLEGVDCLAELTDLYRDQPDIRQGVMRVIATHLPRERALEVLLSLARDHRLTDTGSLPFSLPLRAGLVILLQRCETTEEVEQIVDQVLQLGHRELDGSLRIALGDVEDADLVAGPLRTLYEQASDKEKVHSAFYSLARLPDSKPALALVEARLIAPDLEPGEISYLTSGLVSVLQRSPDQIPRVVQLVASLVREHGRRPTAMPRRDARDLARALAKVVEKLSKLERTDAMAQLVPSIRALLAEESITGRTREELEQLLDLASSD